MSKPNQCCICAGPIDGRGCNPEPFPGDECCRDCDDRWVVPVRMCLGRGFDNENILMLLVTIAELGKTMKAAHEREKTVPFLVKSGG